MLGRGDKSKFWSDIWIGNSSLGDQFPAIAKLSGSNEYTISDWYDISDGVIEWNIRWKRPIQLEEEHNQ